MVEDVQLPPWAHNDPREFIRLHRKALESDYVSEHLHHWIDLIFGYQQRGVESEKIQNVYMDMTYEGTVKIDQVADPFMRRAMIAQVENFGISAKQIFIRPHPKKNIPSLTAPQNHLMSKVGKMSGSSTDLVKIDEAEHAQFMEWHLPLTAPLMSLSSSKQTIDLKCLDSTQSLNEAIYDIFITAEKVLFLGKGKSALFPKGTKYLDWSSTDGNIDLCYAPSYQHHHHVTPSSLSMSSTSPRSNNDSSMTTSNIKPIMTMERVHLSQITCMAISKCGAFVITGGKDAVVTISRLWKSTHRAAVVGLKQRRRFKSICKLNGHEDEITCVAISVEFNLIMSGSADGTAILWDLRRKTYAREVGGHGSAVSHIGINSGSGNVTTVCRSDIRIWSINGDLLACAKLEQHHMSRVTTLYCTRCDIWQDGVSIITGHSYGMIGCWKIVYPSDQLAKASQKEISSEKATEDEIKDREKAVPVRNIYSSSSLELETNENKLVIPSCELEPVVKLASKHKSTITAISMTQTQRQFITADAEGRSIRWSANDG